ncbi:TrbL/VirB6 family protein [Candidatus Midichloria mitochondrii]|uniref:type IV secretion system protein n=1 Tax=Candidatus Midichloria mitochondrii TaxID=234827 RepID=UPI001EEEEF3A|nr:type IV secretion system protein [Candidatus Midichloria mitochondrii]
MNNITNPAKYAAYNTTGEYYIAVEKEVEAAPVSGSLAEILQEIVDYLFKDDPNNPRNGIVPKTFKHFVTDTNFITAVRALLVLYIAFTGISFITGLAQTTQKEAIIRIAKISIVTVLISDRSWDFFNNYLFNLFTVGSLELIVRIASSMNGSMQFNEQEFFNNPSIIFSVFDAPFKQLFSAQVWVKIASLICANLFGFLIAIVIIFAIGMYAICIAKVLMLYLVSIISLGILFLVGPIFICFILFPFTKQFFDSWFKQMLSFALQPVFVITAVAFLNTLLMTALYVTLGFTACKVCILGFSILGFDVCLIPGYMSLASAHHPPTDSFGIPINSLASAIFFLIIGQAMYVFCNFSSSLANMIVTSSFMGLNLSEAAANANPVNALLSAFGSPRGGSAGAGRAGARASGRGGKDRVGGQYDKARRAPFGENLRLDDINANNRKEEENTQEQSKGSDRDSNNSGIE